MRGAICDFISKETSFKGCCCQAANGVSAVNKARELAPDLAILDLGLPMLHCVETASSLRDVVPNTKIIGLAMYAGEFRKSQLAAAGFDMIVSKHEDLANLAEAINTFLPSS